MIRQDERATPAAAREEAEGDATAPPASRAHRIATFGVGAVGVAYPLLILLSLRWLEPRHTALLVLVVALGRFALAGPGLAARGVDAWRTFGWPALGVGAVVATTAIWNDPLGLLLAPVLINLALLASFGLSLRSDRPLVERFARLQVPDLPDDERAYCRSVTIVWCLFFVANGGICLALALRGDLTAWTLYTGFVSYLLIGLLFAVEYVYRHARFRRYRGAPGDALLKRVFPPRAAPPS